MSDTGICGIIICPHFQLVESTFGAYSRAITRQLELENCMRKAVFAGAIALAIMGPLLVSEHGIGPSTASAQEVTITEGHIYRLKRALRLTSEQMSLWHPVEAALRAAIRESRSESNSEGWVQKVRTRVRGYASNAVNLQRAMSAAGPLIASLDETQKRNGQTAIRSMGVASMF
jgi:hypothetical protein